MPVDDREGAFGPRSHIGKHGRMRRLRRHRVENPVCGEVAGEFVVVEQQPAHRLERLLRAGGTERAMGLGQPGQDRARLAHAPTVDLEDRDLTHRVGRGAPGRFAGLAAGEVDADRLPVEPGAIEEQRDLERIARGTDAVQPVSRHGQASRPSSVILRSAVIDPPRWGS